MDGSTFYKSVSFLDPSLPIYLLGLRMSCLHFPRFRWYCWCGNFPPNYQPKANVCDHYCPFPSYLGSEGPSHLPSSQTDFLTHKVCKKMERSSFHSWLYFKRQRRAAQTLIFWKAGRSWLSERKRCHYLLKSKRRPVPALFSAQKPIIEISWRVVAKGSSAYWE